MEVPVIRRSPRLGSFALAAAVAASSFVVFPVAGAYAQAAAADAEMAQFQFSSMVTADNVYVRSGSSENDYPVVKLNKGDVVVAVGEKFDWVKILPPANTYCLVGKAWVDKRGDGTIGRVRDDATNVNVRIASNLNNMITKVALQLHGGTDVTILGEQDEYFKIAPPAGTFMWVHKKFVEPVKRVEVINNNGKLEVKPLDGAEAALPGAAAANANANATAANPTPPQPRTTPEAVPANGSSTAANPTPAPTGGSPTVAATDAPKGPTTAPAQANAELQFDALETKFDESSALPLEQQPIDELLVGYEKVLADKGVPESMLRKAELRVKGLKIRKDALAQLTETKRLREQMATLQQPLAAEAKEIEERIQDNAVKQYAATGTLRPSSLPYGGRTLYRLTDPASGRTVVYVNTDDASVIRMEGLFVGIQGDVVEDPVRRIRFIQPKSAEQIDPQALIKGSITSTLTPPSLLPTAASASKP
jgi:uncharacterized protein YgiM (DUF1202 family)